MNSLERITAALKTQSTLRLRALWLGQLGAWSLSYLLGVATLIATISLLAWAGWFISAAAFAGIGAGFNYMRPAALIRLFAIVRTAGRYGERLQSHAVVLQLLSVLRVHTFWRLATSSITTTLAAGDRLQRLVADIDLLDQLTLRLINPVCWALSVLLLYGLALHWWLPAALPGMLLLFACTLLLLVILLASKPAHHARLEIDLLGQRRGQLLEDLQLLTLLQTSGHFAKRQQQFAQLDAKVAERQRRQHRFMLVTQALAQGVMLAGLAWLSYIAWRQPLQPADIPLWLGLVLAWFGISEVLLPLLAIPQSYGQIRAAQQRCNALWQGNAVAPQPSYDTSSQHLQLAPVKAVVHVVVQRPTLSPSAQATQHALPLETACLTADALCFGYGTPLGRATIACWAGDLVLLQGPSGAGKTCLLETLATERAALAGQLCWQGVDLSTVPEVERYQRLGYLPQRPYLFGLSIAAELRLANPGATDQQLLDVLQLVELQHWFAQQTDGWRTVLGDYGVGLSGGELKRFALARLLLAKPAVLLLDEPFAGLPTELAAQILSRLQHWQRGGIVIVSSHQQTDLTPFSQVWQLH